MQGIVTTNSSIIYADQKVLLFEDMFLCMLLHQTVAGNNCLSSELAAMKPQLSQLNEAVVAVHAV